MKFKNGISIIGSGNVAWHLTHLFSKNNIRINALISRNLKAVSKLAEPLNITYSSDIEHIPENSDLILICISDGAIIEMSKKLVGKNRPIAHTAGSISLDVLSLYHSHSGVFYPFQSFTLGVPITGLEIPICIEASNSETTDLLRQLGATISNKIVCLNSAQRKNLHLSGVLVNNFANFLFAKAYDYLEKQNIDSGLLFPIIQQTARKIVNAHPGKLQTGPAARGATSVIEEHLVLLEGDKDLKEIYELISHKIMQLYKNRNEQF